MKILVMSQDEIDKCFVHDAGDPPVVDGEDDGEQPKVSPGSRETSRELRPRSS